MLKPVAAFLLLIALSGSVAAEETKLTRIGFVGWATPERGAEQLDSLRLGLRQFGYVDGRDIAIEPHLMSGDPVRTEEVIRGLVQSRVDVLVVVAAPVAQIAKEATRTTPIVMIAADPVGAGLAQSLARPGGNITGIASLSSDLAGKRLQYLREIRPNIGTIAFLGSTNYKTPAYLNEAKAAASQNGLKLLIRLVDGPKAFDEALFVSIKREGAEAVVVQPIFTAHHATIVSLAMKHQLAVVADYAPFAESGALIAFGSDDLVRVQRAAYYIDRILKGTQPSDLPIEQPAQFQLIVNLRAAKALGWTIPQSLLLQADRVIE